MFRCPQGILAALLLILNATATAQRDSQHGPWSLATAAKATSPAYVQFVEDRDHIAVIEFSGDYDRDLTDSSVNLLPRTQIAQEFYAHHPDHYDFLIVFTTFEFDTGEARAFHIGVRNSVQGIGLPDYDDSALFGSNGRLQGYIDMAALSRHTLDRLQPGFDRTLGVLAHEIMHQWGTFVRFRDAGGNPSDALLGSAGAHWSFLLDSDASLMYGNDWTLNGDGSFTSTATRSFYSPLDLYLAGFYRIDEVAPFTLIENPAIDPTRLPERGAVIDGNPLTLTIDDILAVEGARFPPAGDAQKEFRSAMILLARPGEQLDDDLIRRLNDVRRELPTRFAILTGGRGVMSVYPQALSDARTGAPAPLPGVDPRPGNASIEDALAWLRAQQQSDGYWQDLAHTRLRDTGAALTTLSRLDADFSGAGAALSWLSRQDTNNTDYLARTAQTFSALRADATALYNALLERRHADGGWGLGPGYASDPWDTALVLSALNGRPQGYADDIADDIAAAAAYLQSRQAADGSWGSVHSGPGRSALSATVLSALAGVQEEGARPSEAAIVWLAGRQHPDGGFGDDASRVLDTTLALRALIALDALEYIDTQAAVSYLREHQTVSGSWDGSVYTTALTALLLKQFAFPNWSLDDTLTITPAAPRDGERVALAVRIGNDGGTLTPTGVLRVYDAPPEQGGRPVADDLEIPVLGPRQTTTLQVLWDSLGQAGARTLVAVVDPDRQTLELSELDNRAEITFNVQAAPARAELEIRDRDILITPSQPQTLPAQLAISATLRNLGQSAADEVRVILWQGTPEDGVMLAEQTVAIAQRSSLAVNFSHMLSTAGAIDFTVQVDADDRIAEADETNNQARAGISTRASVDLAVTAADIELIGDSVHLGSDATFTVRLHNRGTVVAAPTVVRYRVGNGSETRELARHTIQPDGGVTLTQTLVWRVDLSGALEFHVSIDPDDHIAEIDETNNHAALAFSADTIEQANLVVDHRAIRFDPEPALTGQPLTINAQIRNTGGTAVDAVEVAFYQFEVAPGNLLGTQTIATLAAGETATISHTALPLQGQENRLIYVVADPADLLSEFSESDNSAFRLLPVDGLADLTLSTGAVTLQPRFPSPGQTVTLTATVSNQGGQSAENVVVRVFDGDPDQGAVAATGDQTIARIDAGTTAQLSFSWQYGGSSEVRPLVVRVDPDDVVAEAAEDNNEARLNIAVQDADAFVSERYFSPDGDGVRDSTGLFFRLDQPADVVIEILDRRDQRVRRHRSGQLNGVSEGYFEWDGLDDRGSLAADGDYRLQITDSSGSVLGEALATLDTNRSSLLEAAGTPFELTTNLSCLLPDIQDLRLTADEEDFFFFIESHPGEPDPIFSDGIYRMAHNGTGITPLIGESLLADVNIMQLESSGDGSRLAYRGSDQRLWIGDGEDTVWQYDSLALTADSEILGFRDNDSLIVRRDKEIWSLRLDRGFTSPRLLYSGSFIIDRFAFSPDRNRLVVRDVARNSYVGPGPGSVVLLDLSTANRRTLLDITPFRDENAVFAQSFDARPEFAWSADGVYLAVTDTVAQTLTVFDAQGITSRVYPIPDASPPFSITVPAELGDAGELQPVIREIGVPQWSRTGSELALALSYHDGADQSGIDRNVTGITRVQKEGAPRSYHIVYQRIVVFDRPRGEFATVAWSEPGDPLRAWSADPQLAGQNLLAPFGDVLWGPNERILLYAASRRGIGAQPVLGARRRVAAALIRLDDGNRLQPVFERFADFRPQRFSASGRTLLFESDDRRDDPASTCFERAASDTFAFRSLANMTLDLRPRRSTTLGGILLEGTATDLHFAAYRLEYAALSAPDTWHPVMPASVQAVIDDRLTSWIPPAPGTYLMRLTADDLAGNQRRAIKRVAWSDAPAITDLYRTPAAISPNGDGVQDQALIHYRVLEPVHLVFQFYNDSDDPIRTIERSHDQIGIEHELFWDGRDDRGVTVVDGKYRMLVQNFEFYIDVDNTPPRTRITLQPAFQTVFDKRLDKLIVAVDPGLSISVHEANLHQTRVEAGVGDEPSGWSELAGFVPAQSADDPLSYYRTKPLPLKQFNNHRFRLHAGDRAGNTASVSTVLADEELILHRFAGAAVAADDSVLTLNPGVRQVWFEIAETVRAETLQLFMQYRPRQQSNWLETEITRFSDQDDGNDSLPDLEIGALWPLSDIEAGTVYQTRLRLVTATADYLSNPLYFKIAPQEENVWLLGRFPLDGELPLVNLPVALGRIHEDLLQQASADPEFDSESLFVWSVDNIGPAFSAARLYVSSDSDPRYLVPVPLEPVVAVDGGLLFELKHPLPCGNYSGYLQAETVADEHGIARRYTTENKGFGLECLSVETIIAAPQYGDCGQSADYDTRSIELTAESLDGVELVLLTLSRPLADGSEDVLFSINQPVSGHTYRTELDVHDLAEGVHSLISRVSNGEGEQFSSTFRFVVDRTPPTLEFTYPQQDMRLCGVTREVAGRLRSLLDFEGRIEDQGGFFYQLEIDTPLLTDFNELDYDRSIDLLKLPLCYGSGDAAVNALYAREGRRGLPYPGDQCTDVHGPLNRYGDDAQGNETRFSGPATARLHVYDRGGYHACSDVTFYYDGEVEGATVTTSTALFSPNDDGRLDELEITLASSELTRVDSVVYAAIKDPDSDPGPGAGDTARIDGPVLRILSDDLPLLDTATIHWDGRDEGGRVVADGLYGIVTTFHDGCGHSAQLTRFVGVDTTPPAASIAYPRSDDPLALVIEVRGSLEDLNIDRYELAFGAGADPETWAALAQGERNVDDQIIGVWDTFGLRGDFILRLLAVDKAENRSEVRVPLKLDHPLQLIDALQASPRLFSPNGDGRSDLSRIQFSLAAASRVDLTILDETGSVLRRLHSDTEFAQGSAAALWDGLADAAGVLADGVYTARLRARLAANPAVSEQADITLIIDKQLPELVIVSPAGDYAAAATALVASVSDAHLAQYRLAITATPQAPVWQDIDSGSENRIGHYFGNLAAYGAGDYALKLSAHDAADNYAEQIVRFTLDNEPPRVAIIAPAGDSLLSALDSPYTVQAELIETHLNEYRLEFSHVATPDQWTLIADGNRVSGDRVNAGWDVGGLADGAYQLRLSAGDRAGQTGSDRIGVIIDNSAPDIAITTPAEGAYISAPVAITGSVGDAHLREYRLAIAPGEKASAAQWSPLGRGEQTISSGVLLDWQALPPDGLYTLRLSAQDRAGNQAVEKIELHVDTTPPAAPLHLSAARAGERDVKLTWNPAAATDLAGYRVYRDDVLISGALMTSVDYLDENVADGTYRYHVSAVDHAGLESEPSAPAEIVVDTTPPRTRIQAPAADARVGGLLDIKGTAYSPDDFKEYRLYLRAAHDNAGEQLLRRSPAPVQADLLAQWDTLALAEEARYVLRLESEDLSGNIGSAEVSVTVDNQPPAAPAGLSADVSGNDIRLDWNDNSEADLLGYLLFRDDRLVNAQTVVVGELTPYALSVSAYADDDRPDGRFNYDVYAIDRAGNLSDPSAPVQVTIDTRAPQALIVAPPDGHRFEQPLFIQAVSADSDIAQVQFQYKAATAPATANHWIDLGAADTAPPWQTTWDAGDLPYADYRLRALARDHSGIVDPEPQSIGVRYTDLDRPQTVQDVTARVDGDSVVLDWRAVGDDDLAGYHVERRGPDDTSVRLTSDPLTATGYTDSGLADAVYYYTVIAVDAVANESDASAPVPAEVYTPRLLQPYTPTTASDIELGGSGGADARVGLTIAGAAGQSATAEAFSDDRGQFSFAAVALFSGLNTLTLRISDDHGNVSKTARTHVLSTAAPAAPGGLTAVLDADTSVELDWDIHPEPDVIGYRVFRNGSALLEDSVVGDLTASASSRSAYAGYAIDDNRYTYWAPQASGAESAAGQWLQLSLPAAAIVTGLELFWAGNSTVYTAADYDIQGWDGSVWVTLAQIRDNTAAHNVITLPQTYRSTRFRVLIKRGLQPSGQQYSLRLVRIELRRRAYLEAPGYRDTVADGRYGYSVTALDQYGFESPSSDTAGIAAGDTEAPQPVVLSAAVSGSDVLLSWSASASDDVLRYELYRDGGKIAEHTDLTALSYTDGQLADGHYRYHVTAVDAIGNVSDASNEVTVSIARAPLAGPTNLRVEPVAAGGALDLSWQPGGADIVHYRIERATVSGGPYRHIATHVGTDYRDSGLDNGVTYYYVVIGVDGAGNQSPPSNEAGAAPLDSNAPAAPLLHAPGLAGLTYHTTATQTDIAGYAEPGVRVDLYRDHLWLGDLTTPRTLSVDATSLYGWYGQSLSPDGRYLLVNRYSAATVYDYRSGDGQTLSERLIATEWTADNTLIYTDRYRIKRYDAVTRHIETLASAQYIWLLAATTTATVAADRIAVLARRNGSVGWYLLGLNDNDWTLLVDEADPSSIVSDSVSWSPDASQLVYRRSYGELEIIDVAAAGVSLIDSTAVSPPHWSRDGAELIYFSRDGGSDYLKRYRPASASIDTLSSVVDISTAPQWSPDNRSIVWIEPGGDMRRYDVAGGDITLLYQADALDLENPSRPHLQWLHNGYLAVLTTRSQRRLLLPGYFQFTGIHLDDGDNYFTASAEDDAGQRSERSAPMRVHVDVEQRPDLSIKTDELIVLPAIAQTGAEVRISATVRNIGRQTAAASDISLVVQGPDGSRTTLAQAAALASLAPGGAYTLRRDFTIPDDSGRYTIVAVVDPRDALAEISETNNYAQYSLTATADARPALSVGLARRVYFNDQDVIGSVEVINPGDPFTGRLRLGIEDSEGFVVEQLTPVDPLELAFNQRLHELVDWNSADLYAGDYRLRAVLEDSHSHWQQSATADFAIAEVIDLQTRLSTDRVDYLAADTVAISAAIDYLDGNVALAEATARFTVTAADGEQIDQWMAPLNGVLPGSRRELTPGWNNPTAPPGQYRLHLDIEYQDRILASSETLFERIARVVEFAGGLFLSDPEPTLGDLLYVDYSIENRGNLAFSQLPVTIRLLQAAQGEPLDERRITIDLQPGARYDAGVDFATGELDPQDHLVVLSVLPARSELALAVENVTPRDRQAPRIDIVVPREHAFLDADLGVEIAAGDIHSGIRRVEVSVNSDTAGDTWNALDLSDAGNGIYTGELDFLADGHYQLTARALDQADNRSETAPRRFRVDRTPPRISISGVGDGAQYTRAVTPLIDIDEAYPATRTITLNGAPFVSGTAITRDGAYTLSVSADDEAGNQAQRIIAFSIQSAAPSLPVASVADIVIDEGDTGTRSAVFTLRLAAPAAQPLSVDYSTVAGSALAGEDFIAAVGSITLAAGERAQFIPVAIIGDDIVEDDETFQLRLSNPRGVTLAPEHAVATIRNDDSIATPDPDPEPPPVGEPAPPTPTDGGGPAAPAAAAMRVTLSDSLLIDVAGDHRAGPGDTLGYTLRVANTGDVRLTGLRYQADVPAHTASSSPATSVAFVHRFADLEPGATATFRYRVVIDKDIASTADVSRIRHQGEVSSDQLAPVTSDDPNTLPPGDATLTPLTRAVAVPTLGASMLILLGLLLLGAGYVAQQRRC